LNVNYEKNKKNKITLYKCINMEDGFSYGNIYVTTALYNVVDRIFFYNINKFGKLQMKN